LLSFLFIEVVPLFILGFFFFEDNSGCLLDEPLGLLWKELLIFSLSPKSFLFVKVPYDIFLLNY